MTIKQKIPAPSTMLVANLLGALGLLLVVIAVGGLTHNWWWSVLAGGAAAVGLSVIGLSYATDETQAASAPAAAGSAPVTLSSAA